MSATIIGYPRIGARRELKKLQEDYWAKRVDLEGFLAGVHALRERIGMHVVSLGLERSQVPESFSLYDQVLDTLATLGAIPQRFAHVIDASANRSAAEVAVAGSLGVDGYFALARGTRDQPALEMTKWWDTNYHFIVPEIDPGTVFFPCPGRLVELAKSGARPVLVGPITFMMLARSTVEGFSPLDRLGDALDAYEVLLRALSEAGVHEVQLDEPALGSDALLAPELREELIERAYPRLSAVIALFVTTPYGDASAALNALGRAGVARIHVDIHRGSIPTALQVSEAVECDIVAGVIDGRSVWKADLAVARARVDAVRAAVAEAGGDPNRVGVCTAVSLQHVPHTIEDERGHLAADLLATLAFADEKVGEVLALARHEAPAGGRADDSLSVSRDFSAVRDPRVRARVDALSPADYEREDYERRVAAQREALNLPLLPTTSIGSFPQTKQVRRARADFRTGVIDEAQYKQRIREEITRVIRLQEEIGLDVLVHGEPERNDMVQYFAEHLEGFATTKHGWVQSYGSRCTRPSILFGDVSRPAPITVEWARFANSLTDAPVKGMLTGPVTIVAWSFVRDDQPLSLTATQVALALRDEVQDLEAAGVEVIQVDEPALRELLPLSLEQQEDYKHWSTRAFRLATASASARTQVHTHLCYSEFNEVIDAISDLGADVTTIESARSHGDIVRGLEHGSLTRQIGPGVWDIHSPRVPDVSEIRELIESALHVVGSERLWVNPDCGLKTRGYEETEASLRNLVEATRAARAAVAHG